MSLYDSGAAYQNLRLGQLALLVCCVFYVAWWAVAFRPVKKRRLTALTVVLLALAVVFGGFGLCASFIAVNVAPTPPSMNLELVCLVAGLTFIALYALTYLVFRRRFTCELFLIVLLTVVEICAADVFAAGGYLSAGGERTVFLVLALASLISLVFYVLYYRLGPVASYVTAMIPLFASGAAIGTLYALVDGLPLLPW